MEFNKLRGRIVEVFGTLGKFCDAVGVTPQLLSMKLSGKSDFTYAQIVSFAKALNIPNKNIGDYFF